MTAYRPFRRPSGPVARKAPPTDARVNAAASILYRPLPRSAVVQVPWSVRVLRGIADVCFAVALVAAFGAGAVLVARVVDGPGVAIAMLAYALAFGWLARKLKL